MCDQINYTYDLFISYSHHDSEWVRETLLPRLESEGLRVCIDYRDFEIGVPNLINMERAVDGSHHTLIVLTPSWRQSEWTEFESLLASATDPAGRRKKLIPLMLESCELPRRIQTLTYADFTQPDKRSKEFRRLLEQLTDTPEAKQHSNEIVSSSDETDIASINLENKVRLQHYLPLDLYQRIKGIPSSKQVMDCTEHLIQLLRDVVTYVPRHVALDLLEKPVAAHNSGEFLAGTLLFADISGFTALSEAMMEKGGREGAEEIVRVVNEYLDVMLNILFKHDGLLVKFGGDAMLCMFTGEKHGALEAVLAAWEMKQTMEARFSEVEALGESVMLGMKVGSNSGQLFAANVGTVEHMEFVVTGNAVEHTALAESVAQKGDILISKDTYKLLEDYLEAEHLAQEKEFYRVMDIRPDLFPSVENAWQRVEGALGAVGHDVSALVERLDALTPYLPAGVLPKLVYSSQQGEITGQHRQVTVLFANFEGISDIIAATDEDKAAVAEVLSEYFTTMQYEIRHYGGVVNKVDLYEQGDKLMAIFGAPMAHGQDAQRAALTALAMQDAMENKLHAPYAEWLTQRIGIHTGYVFAGNVGSSECQRREYTVMGDTVNLAARLMSEASNGEIWISPQVWERVRNSFKAEELAPVKFKGIDEKVPVYRLEADYKWVDRPWQRSFDSVTVGRESELEALAKHFEDIVSGAWKQAIAIVGETGVGKSRLVDEWKEQMRHTKVIWLTGRAYAYGQKTHGVFVEILEQILGFTAQDTDGTRWNKLGNLLKQTFENAGSGWGEEYLSCQAYLGQFLSLDFSGKKELESRVERLDAESLQLQTRLAICDLLTYTARKRPLVLILEDLHWADLASLDLLKFVSMHVAVDAPLLFCLVYRPRKEHPVWMTWDDIKRAYPSSDWSTIELKELEETDGAKLLHNLLGCRIPEDLQPLILDATDGNPLYIEEVIHDLIADGTIQLRDGRCHVTRNLEDINVPDTLAQIIQSRIDELEFSNPGTLRVLWLASVIGDEFTQALLSHLYADVEGGRRELFAMHLQTLMVAGLIEKERIRGQWQYRFRHGLVRQVAYENILVKQRRVYHRAVGEWLEREHAQNLQRYYDTLAYHYDVGQQWDKAFEYHWLAGEQSAKIYANLDAKGHLVRALKIVEVQHFEAVAQK